MIAVSEKPIPPRAGGLMSILLISIPLLLVVLCFLSKFGLVTLPQGLRAGLIFALLLALMMTGMPISIALGLTVLTFLFTLTDVPIEAVALKLFTGIEKFEIMAIPFFILAGNFLTHGGVARRMINFASALVGYLPGGLALAGVVACAIFAAISGSSPATVVAIGSIILPAMVAKGFPKRFGAGVIATSGALGILIPPSIAMVIYSVSTSGMSAKGPDGKIVQSASVGDLFIAGVIPGLMLAFLLGLTTFVIAWRRGYPRMEISGGRSVGRAMLSAGFGLVVCCVMTLLPLVIGWWIGFLSNPGYGLRVLAACGLGDFAGSGFSFVAQYKLATFFATIAWLGLAAFLYPRRLSVGLLRHEAARVWDTYWESIWGLLLIVVVMGGIYTGAFTPTEAAAMSAVYAFFVAMFVYRDMGWGKVRKVLIDSAQMSAMLLYIITNAVLFSFLMTSEQIPQAMADWIIGQGLGWFAFLLFVNVLLLLAGNVMEPSSIILIMAPILFPVAVRLGIDPIHFGILITVNMEVGLCHPPVGLNLYVASGITKMGISELTVAVMPWLLTMLGFLVVVTYWPELSLWLPRQLARVPVSDIQTCIVPGG